MMVTWERFRFAALLKKLQNLFDVFTLFIA
jgi:hypothetical protein